MRRSLRGAVSGSSPTPGSCPAVSEQGPAEQATRAPVAHLDNEFLQLGRGNKTARLPLG